MKNFVLKQGTENQGTLKPGGETIMKKGNGQQESHADNTATTPAAFAESLKKIHSEVLKREKDTPATISARFQTQADSTEENKTSGQNDKADSFSAVTWTTLEWAQYYSRIGLSVIPVKARSKKPLGTWEEFQTRKPNADELKTWFKDTNHNIGIVTGEVSGIAVVDLDSDEALQFTKDHGFPDGPTVSTSRGYHLYFNYKDGVRNFQKRDGLPDIDLRGEGGYAVAPPSIHESGHQYQWLDGKGLDDDIPLPSIPEIILAKKSADKSTITQLLRGVKRGKRNDSLAKLAGRWAWEGLSVSDAMGNAHAWNLKNEPPMPGDEVDSTVKSIFKKNEAEGSEYEWQEPILFDDNELPPFPRDIIPDPVGEFVREVARFTETPPELAALLALAAVSTAAAKKYEVQPKPQYCEPVNIWVAIALDSGNRKTSVFNSCIAPIMDWEKAKNKEQEPLKKRIESETLTARERLKVLRSQAARTKNDGDRQKLEAEINDIENDIQESPPIVKLYTQDITPEKLGSLMADNDGRGAILSDEGGIFEIMGGRYSNGIPNLDIFLQPHAGTDVRVDRGNRPSVNLQKPSLVIGLSPQPVVLEGLQKPYLRGRGLLARFLYALPKSNLGYRTLDQLPIAGSVTRAYYEKIKSILDTEFIIDDLGNHRPFILKLTEDAFEQWFEFQAYNEIHMREGGSLSHLTDWASKLPGTAARIAGLFHIIKHEIPDGKAIDDSTMYAAIKLCQHLIPHAHKAFTRMGGAPYSDAKHVWYWIKSHRLEAVKHQDLWQGVKGRFGYVAPFNIALKILEDRNYIRANNTTKSKGRPGRIFQVNPMLVSDWE